MNTKKQILSLLGIVIIALGAYYYLYQGSTLSLLENITKNSAPALNIATDASTASPLILATDGVVKFANATLEVDLSQSLGAESAVASEIKSLKGLGAGAEFISGVHIDASEAILGTPGTLSIDIPEGTDTTNLAGISYSGDGEDFHLYPIKIEDNKAIFSINHFSGYGIVLLAPTYEDPPTSSYEATVQQLIMTEFLKLQRQQILGEENDLSTVHKAVYPEIWKWLTALDTEYVTPATKDASKLHAAITEYVRFLQIVQSIGDSFDADERYEFDTKIQAIEKKLVEAVKKANDTALAACREKKDPDQAALLIRLYALAELSFSGDFDYILDSARTCAQFTLVIDTTVTEPDYLNGCELKQTYYGEIPLTLDPKESFSLSGEGVVEGTIELCDSVCTVTQGSLDQPVKVPAVQIIAGGEASIRFMIDVPEAEVPVEWSCTQKYDGGTMSVGDLYEWAFTLLDTEVPMLTSELFVLEDWKVVKEGDVYAKQVWTGKVPGSDPFPIYIDTTYTLKHTPSK